MVSQVHVRVLDRAAELLGSADALARRLGARPADLAGWMRGEGRLPERVFLAAVDVIMEDDAQRLRRSAALRQGSAERIARALETLARAQGPLAGRLEGGGLLLKAQRGFGEPFLRFFADVRHETSSACATALAAGQRIVVADVASSPIFAGTASRDVLLAEGIAAVQSTPLIGPHGDVVGMLSTHYDHPGEPPDADLEVVDRIAARAQAWIGARAR